MPVKPENRKIPEGTNRPEYPLMEEEVWITGAYVHRGLDKNNPTLITADPNSRGDFTSNEHANGHFRSIVDSTQTSISDSRTTVTAAGNHEIGTAGGEKTTVGGGTYDDTPGTKCIAAGLGNIDLSGGAQTKMGTTEAHFHVSVTNDVGLKARDGAMSLASATGTTIQTNASMHINADNELSMRTSQGNIAATTKKNFVIKADSNISQNAKGGYFRVNSSYMTWVGSRNQVVLKAGDSTGIIITDGLIQIIGAQIKLKSSGAITNDPAPPELDGQGSTGHLIC